MSIARVCHSGRRVATRSLTIALLSALALARVSTSALAAGDPPVAVDDAYHVAEGATLITVPEATMSAIQEIIDATGNGLGAVLDGPEGVAVDGAGNVFVTGSSSDNVFEITPGGVVTVIIDATGDGGGNTLDAPFGVTTDGTGNVYVTGSGSHNAFRITPGGVITEIIDATGDGGGNTLAAPFGVAVDAAGNVFVSGRDTDNVFEIEAGTGTITEIIDATGDGGGNTLDAPFGVSVDAAGNVFVAARGTDNAFRITPGGVITEIIDATGDGIGNPLDCGNFSAPSIAVDGAGNAYMVGANTNNVFRITPGGVITEIIDATGDGLGNTLSFAQGLAADAAGNAYVSGAVSDNVFRITSGGVITEIIDITGDGAGNGFDAPDYSSVAVDAAGTTVYATAFFTDNAFAIPPDGASTTGGITELIDGNADGMSSLVNPDGIDVDTDGTVYVGGCGNNPGNSNVYKIETDGTITNILDGTGDGVNAFNCPVGTEIDSAGNLWVAGHRSDNVFKVTPGGVITQVMDATGDEMGNPLLEPFDIAIDGDDNVYVTGFGSDNVFRIAPGGQITEVMDASGDGAGNTLTAPFGIAVDAAGNVYVAGNLGDNAFEITPDGRVIEIIDATGDGVHPLTRCADVAVDGVGNVYVTGNASDNAFKITPDGVITQIIELADGIDNPTGIDVTAAGTVYVCGFESDNVVEITPGGVISEILTSAGDGANGFDGPADDCIALDGSGNIYVTGTLGFHNVYRIPAAGIEGVLTNDSDPDGETLTAALVTGASNGAVVLETDGTFTYTHDGSETTSDSFTYRANDGSLDSGIATVTIDIDPVNEAPSATDDDYTGTAGGMITSVAGGDPPGVLDDDVDVDGAALAATELTGTSHGILSLQADGSFVYTHDGSVNLVDGFTYEVSDGLGGTDVGAVTLTLQVPDEVAADPAGVCVSTADTCVTVPVVFTRVDVTEARAATVSIQLSPELELCGAITQGTWLTGFTSAFQVVDDGGGAYTVDQAILGLPCGVATGGVLFEIPVRRSATVTTDSTGTITVTSVGVRDCDNQPIPGAPGPAGSVPIDITPPATVTDLATSQVKSGNGADGTTAITVSLGVPVDATSLVVFRKGYGDYPEYDDGTGTVPSAPASPDDALADGWTATAVTASGETDEPAARDVWFYVAFTEDACGNVSAVSNLTGGTLNYHLGDVSDGVTPGLGDNAVGVADLSSFGASYGITLLPGDPLGYLDVGPTLDFSVDARPTTDNVVDFEDLILMAVNYGEVSREVPARAGDGPAPVIALELDAVGDLVRARLMLSGNAGRVKGAHARLAIGGLDRVDVRPGSLLASQTDGIFFRDLFRDGDVVVDWAVLGSGKTLAGDGELATLTFRAVSAGARPALESVDLRGRANRRLGSHVQPDGATSPPWSAPALLGAFPSPFHGTTEIVFRIPDRRQVSVEVFDVSGQLVRRLLGGPLSAGEHRIVWGGDAADGHRVAAGIYFYRFDAGDLSETRKLVYTR